MLKTLKCCNWNFHARHYAKKLKTSTADEMKYLCVAEKNDAAKTIAGLLSNGTANRRDGYSVYNKIYEFEANVKGRQSKMVMTSVSGHLLHLEFLSSYRNWRSIDPQALFDAPVRKACSEDFEPIKRTLEREIRGCQGLIVWTDCDREGENIGFEIVEVCRRVKPNISVHRAIFSEITATAVRRALAQLKTPDQRQSDAVDVRTELDLRTGAAITRFQTMRLQRLFPAKIADKLISYGSCQIPTLGFVVERYKEVEAFVSEPFWKIKVIHTIEDLTVEFSWARNRLFDKQACEDFLLICLADPKAKVEVVTVKPKNKWRPVAMDTVELEKLGSRKLKLSAKETMTIAEKLYTKGIISYPRTETNQFSKDIDLRSLVEQQTGHSIWGSFAERVREWGPNPRNGNKSDQAHPPIHPTKLVTNLTGNEGRVYELIVRHFLACVSKDAVGSETIVHINIAGEKFTATGLVIYERNYLDVYIYEKWNAKQIHHYEEGQIFDPTDITMVEGATTAPPLLTEADLIALMEKHGIGTDATHAEHINTIKERGYIGVVDNGSLVPGVIGMGLYEGYDAMQLALAKPVLRAAFEEDLKKICQGTKDPKAVLAEQIQKYKEAYRQIMANITAMDEKMGLRISETPTARTNDDSNAAANLENNPNLIQELFQCPKCNSAPLALKPKRNQGGHFIGCLNYPDCKNVVWFPEECKEPKVIDEFCQHCGGVAKLLKFKFQTAFHKTMFNAPYGWYKTCLRCDGKFRETFNINVETVKRVGAIVGDRMTARSVAPTAVAAEANSNLRNRNNAQTRNNGPLGSNPTSRPSDDGSGLRNKKPKKTSTTTTAQPARNGNIRSFFTAASTRQEDKTQNTTNQHAPLEELFDSNDGFEEALQAVEASNLVSNTNATPQQSRSSALAADVVLDADLAAVFADDSLGDFNWDTSESSNNRTEQSRTIQTTHSTNFSWGTAGNANRAPSRPPTNCSNDNWGSGARRGPNPSAINPYSRRESGNGTPSTSHNPRHVNRPSGTSNENVDDDFSWGTGAGFRGAADAVIQDPDVSFGTLVGSRAENFDDYTWGSAANRSKNDNDSSSNGPTNKRPRLQTPQSSLDRPTWSNITPQQHDVKCTGCHQLAKELTVRKDGPNKGRQFYACPKSNACKFFQWADEEPQANTSMQSSSSSGRQSQGSAAGGWGTGASVRTAPSSQGASAGGWGTTANIRTASNSSNSPTLSGGWGTGPNAGANEDPANSDSIKCSCGKAASSLTVRKDGPNKGRPFYACPNRDKSCGFFKWGDEDDNQASTSAAAQQRWGTAAARNYTPGGGNGSSSTDQQREPKKRKCGLCRQEGHTKLKCPRKAEFDV